MEALNGEARSISIPFLTNAKGEKPVLANYIDLEWSHLTVEVVENTKEKRKRIVLDDCSGYINHGRMLSIMGPSGFFFFGFIIFYKRQLGAGKTSLLNMLSGKISKNKKITPSGEVRFYF